MATPSLSLHPDPWDQASLDRLAEVVDDGVGPDQPPTLVRVEDAPGGIALGLKPLPGGWVEDALECVDAPPEWVALGVVAEGWARSTVDVDAERRRARTTLVIHRSGMRAGRLVIDGEVISSEPPTGGLVDDLLLRSLGVGTPPPESGTVGFFASMWLSDVLGEARVGGSRTWKRARANHPALRVLHGTGSAEEEDLVEAGSAFSRVCTWEVLRSHTIERGWEATGIPPLAAAWYDVGSFARRAEAFANHLDPLLAELERSVPTSVLRRVRSALRAWDLLPSCP